MKITTFFSNPVVVSGLHRSTVQCVPCHRHWGAVDEFCGLNTHYLNLIYPVILDASLFIQRLFYHPISSEMFVESQVHISLDILQGLINRVNHAGRLSTFLTGIWLKFLMLTLTLRVPYGNVIQKIRFYDGQNIRNKSKTSPSPVLRRKCPHLDALKIIVSDAGP